MHIVRPSVLVKMRMRKQNKQTVFNTNNQLQYSFIYADSLQGACTLSDFDYRTPLTNVMQTL